MSSFEAYVLSRPAPVARRPLHRTQLPTPELGPNDVLVDVAACGVCRTDLQLCEGDLRPRRLPIVPGHQIVGTVVDLGDDVSDVDIAQQVGVAWIAGACGRCRFCSSGRENLCDDATFTGWDRDGGFAQFAVADAGFVFPMSGMLDPVAAAPLLCGGSVGLRSLKVCEIEAGGRLGLFGFGASATCVIQIARYWGCEVYVVTRSVEERRRALDLGARWVGPPGEPLPVRLDAAISFAPVGSVVVDALRALDKGGVVAVNAIHLDGVPAFDYEDLWWERQIRSVANVTRADVVELIELAGDVPIRTTVTTYPLDEANQALLDLSTGQVSGAAVLTVDPTSRTHLEPVRHAHDRQRTR